MAGACVASPLCTWLVGTCMSAVWEDRTRGLGKTNGVRWARWRRVAALKASRESSTGFISAFYGSGIQGLVSSLEPCDAFYSRSRNGSAFFGDSAFSLFGTRNSDNTRRRRRRANPCSGYTNWGVHPNINLENPEECVDVNVLVGSKERLDVRVALSNSFGFGRHNSSVLFAPYK